MRAGRGLVPTPHALALRERVRALAAEARAVLQPAARDLDLTALERIFTIRANEGFVETFAARFAPKPDKDVRFLREGLVDLEVGVLGETGPEVMIQALFEDRFVGVVRPDHPLLAGAVTAARYAACDHVVASRRGRMRGPVDDALAGLGLERRVSLVVPSFPAALAVAAASDLVGLVTRSFVRAGHPDPAGAAALPVRAFALPVATPPITVSQMWHPRADADPAHRWLRGMVLSVCRAEPGRRGTAAATSAAVIDGALGSRTG